MFLDSHWQWLDEGGKTWGGGASGYLRRVIEREMETDNLQLDALTKTIQEHQAAIQGEQALVEEIKQRQATEEKKKMEAAEILKREVEFIFSLTTNGNERSMDPKNLQLNRVMRTRLSDIKAKHGFDISYGLKEELSKKLRDKGYMVVWEGLAIKEVESPRPSWLDKLK